MEVNDFFVGIQAILMKAKDAGWTTERIVETAKQAVEEFELEEFTVEEGDTSDEYE